MNHPITFLAAILAIFSLHAAEAGNVPCRIAYLAKIHYAPVIIALADGQFTKAGLDVQPVLVGPGSGVLTAEALATGAADAATMGDGPTLISCTRSPLPVILGAYAGAEKQHRMIARAGITIKKPSDLVGKRLAVHQGSSTYGGLMLYLKQHKISLDSITIVNLNPKDMAAALQASQADIALASDPIPDLLIKKVTGTTEAGDLSGLGTDYPYCCLYSRRWAEANPDGAKRLTAALTAAIEVINTDKEKAVRLVAAATKDSVEDTKRWMDQCQWKLRPSAEILPSLKILAEAMATSLPKPAKLVEAAK